MTNETREELERVWHNTAKSAKYYDVSEVDGIDGISEIGWYFIDEGYQYWGPYTTAKQGRRYCFGYWAHMIEMKENRAFKDINECFKFFDSMLAIQQVL